MGRINVRRFIKACKDSGGIISIIAKRMSVSRTTLYDYIQREPIAQKYLQEAKEDILDMAESKLISSMNLGEIDSIKWYLARIGKNRGFSEKPEIVTQTNVQVHNIPATYKIVIENPDDIRN